MGKTILPVPRATHTTVDVDIDGLDDYISNNSIIVEAKANLHSELHTIDSHTDTTKEGTVLDELTSGESTDLHFHEYNVNELDGGEF